MDFRLSTSALAGFIIGSALFIIILHTNYQTEINRILNEPLRVESVTRYLEQGDQFKEEVYIWTVCNVKCYELKRKQNIAIGVELEVNR